MRARGLTATLLRPGAIAMRRFFALGEQGGGLRLTAGSLLAAGVGAGIFAATYRALRFFSGVEMIGYLLTARLLEFMLLGIVGFVFMSSLVSALGTFYLSEDLSLVRSAPMPEGPFFIARWLETATLAGWMVVGFGAPVIAAYGAALSHSAAFVPVAVLAFLPLALMPAAVGIVLITLLVCVFPARKVRELFLVFGVIAAALLLLLLRVAQPERLMRPEVFGSVANYVAAFQAPQSILLPSAWSATAMQAALRGEIDWLALALLWSGVWGTASAAYLVHLRLYRLAFSRAQEGGPGSFGSAAWLERILDRLSSFSRPEWRAFARKDSRIFLRDPGQWSQLLILLTLIVAYVYNYAVYPGADVKIAGIYVNHLLGVLNLILAGFVLSALVARFAFPAVSMEGRAFWLVRTAPLTPRKFLAVKYALALAPLMPLAVVLVGLTVYWIKLPVALAALSVVHIVFVTACMTALGLGLGTLYPRFKFENPAQVPMSFGGIMYMLIATGYTFIAALWTAWLAVPMAYPHVERTLTVTVLGWALWLTFHLLHAMIPLRLASRALAKKEYV
jgi:ABC-2 type transport system permease protein